MQEMEFFENKQQNGRGVGVGRVLMQGIGVLENKHQSGRAVGLGQALTGVNAGDGGP